MRLTEAELARRLEHAAGTMEGGELVAERCPARGASICADYQTNSCGISRSAMAPDRPGQRAAFDIGDEVYATDVSGKVHRGFVAPSTVTGCYLVKTTDAAGYFSEKSLEMVRRVGDVEDSPRFKVGDRVVVARLSGFRSVPGVVRETRFGICDVDFDNGTFTRYAEGLLQPESQRLKVGDLVRVPFAGSVRVGIVTAVPEEQYVCFNVKVDCTKHVYAACDVCPYTLPTINSYAELAAALDELPEGWRVERCRKSGDGWCCFSRNADGTYRERAGVELCSWTRRELLAGINESRYPEATHRVLPPESGK